MSIAVEPRWARRVAQADGVVWMEGAAPLERVSAATLGEHPRAVVPIVGVTYEAAIGLLALSPGRRRRLAGMAGIAAFHGGLLVLTARAPQGEH